MIELLPFAALILIAVISVAGLKLYCHPSISKSQRVFLFLSLFAAFSNLVLIWVDIYLNLFEIRGVDLTILWRVSFWTTFVNSWAILPLIRNYLNSKSPTNRGKFLGGLKRQCLVWLVQFVLIGSLLIYLYYKFGDFRFFPVLFAVNNSFGFLIIIVSLGYSLVSIPRHLKHMILDVPRIDETRDQINELTALNAELLIPIELEYKKAFHLIRHSTDIDDHTKKLLNERMLPEVLSILPALDTEFDSESLKKKPSVESLDSLNLKFLINSRKLRELKERVSYFEISKHTFKFKLRNFIVYNLMTNAVVFGAVVLFLEIFIPFEEKYNFNLFQYIAGKTSMSFAFMNSLNFIIYLIICVFYANLKIRIGTSYSLEKNLTSISAAVFFVT